MSYYYPIALDLADRRVLIVGAGAVAQRKLRGVLEAGAADVTVVAPQSRDELPPQVRWLKRSFEPGDLDGIDLCFAATDDPAVNELVARLCRERHILCNRADRDDSEPGDFTVPAIHRDGPLTVAVWASGSPRLAGAVRDAIADSLDPAWGQMGQIVGKIRERVVSNPAISMTRRKTILAAISSIRALQAYKTGGEGALMAMIADEFPELKGSL